ncbi:helix-turn-helix domain-containing protein [Streptosporangium amethystogenes subsp. fukuiense]|uniref:Helix-turn-helix domain-containing protein n=1 Tax=Streptosporangium amethystogenes subsp. fukuiense TaxID=698418 RepID=A0ABW2TBL8_9ACTN
MTRTPENGFPSTPEQLLELGIDRLRKMLGQQWEVVLEADACRAEDLGHDALITITSPDRSLTRRVLVETKPSWTPALLERELLPRVSLMRRLSQDTAVLVIAPWISPQTRALLSRWDCGYIDLTGNVSFRMNQPAIVLETQGAARDPRPRTAGAQRGLSGARAGRLVRVLADVRPTYRATELAETTGLSGAYVSRLLDTLEEEAIIRRRNKVVVKVDWEALLRLRASETSLLRPGRFLGFLAPNGLDSFIGKLLEHQELHTSIALTGPLAATKVAPLAIGGQGMLYATEEATARLLEGQGLFPVNQGADVLLLQPPDTSPFFGVRQVDGLPHVALSQLVLDSLSGPGRLPAAGEAVLNYMRDHEKNWRLDDLDGIEFPPP